MARPDLAASLFILIGTTSEAVEREEDLGLQTLLISVCEAVPELLESVFSFLVLTRAGRLELASGTFGSSLLIPDALTVGARDVARGRCEIFLDRRPEETCWIFHDHRTAYRTEVIEHFELVGDRLLAVLLEQGFGNDP